jgi:hypothetical protein
LPEEPGSELSDSSVPLAAEPDSAPPPLTEAEDPDQNPVEREEELALGPIDVQGLEGVDLEGADPDKSRHAPVVKAKPMIKAAPSGPRAPVS